MVSLTVTRRPFYGCVSTLDRTIVDLSSIPSHQWLWQYLLRPSLATDLGAQSWVQALRRRRLHLRLLSRCYGHTHQREAAATKIGENEDSRWYAHLLHLTGIEFWSCGHICQPDKRLLRALVGYIRISRKQFSKSCRCSKKLRYRNREAPAFVGARIVQFSFVSKYQPYQG